MIRLCSIVAKSLRIVDRYGFTGIVTRFIKHEQILINHSRFILYLNQTCELILAIPKMAMGSESNGIFFSGKEFEMQNKFKNSSYRKPSAQNEEKPCEPHNSPDYKRPGTVPDIHSRS